MVANNKGNNNSSDSARFSEKTIVPLRIMELDQFLWRDIKTAGARWDAMERLWFVHYGNIIGTELEKYIHIDA